MTIASVADLIESHEGRKNLAYQDSRGIWTVGVGHNLQSKPMPDAIITALRDADIADARVACFAIFLDFPSYADARQAAICDMIFNMGEHEFRQFSHMIAAIAAGDWETAAAEALSSQWASQVPARAKADALMLKTSQWPDTV